MLGHEHTLLAT